MNGNKRVCKTTAFEGMTCLVARSGVKFGATMGVNFAVILGACMASAPLAAANGLLEPSLSGHAKYRFQAARYPTHSVYNAVYGDSSTDHLLDSRWKLSSREQQFDIEIDYQLQALHGDRLRSTQLIGGPDISQPYPDDDRRVFDFTKVIGDDEDTAILHRLDRFNIGYTGENTVLRVGRQVVSWGNGLIFNPVDFFNPFDPAALDTEYKTGDDMVYGQYLMNNGDDLQGVVVGRRNASNSLAGNEGSSAIKYHSWLDNWLREDSFLAGAELDLLIGEHYDDAILAAGLVKSFGGAVWRGELMFTRTDRDEVVSGVTNLSYSWVWANTNFSGMIEYYYNGFGLDDGDYSLAAIQQDDDLQARLSRGELYNLGRHYLGLSASAELTALWLFTPTLLVNLDDQSALLQLSSSHSLAQNWEFLGALNLPLGSKNTEYGGIKTGVGQSTIATDGGLFAQLAFYF